MLSQTIAILINPNLKDRKLKGILNKILIVLLKRNMANKSYREEWPTDINIFKEVWIIGGDGTLNYLLNYYKTITIPIAIFKGGTGNDFAWKLYGKVSIAKQLNNILVATPKKVDAAECNGRIFINGIGLGFDGEVLRSIKTVRLIGGHIGYLLVVIKKIFIFKEHRFTIRFDGKMIEGNFLLVLVTNSTRTGGGFLVSPEASIVDGKLNMILCQPFSITKRLMNLPIIQNGKHLDKNYIIHKLVNRVVIECKKKLYAQLDGELIDGKTFTIKVTPQRYLFKY